MLAGVDVVRGPVANIYGSGAIGGVVSFRTKDIEDVVKAGERWGVLSTGMVGSNIFRDMASMFAGARVHPNVDVFGGIVYRRNENYRDGDGKEWPNTGFDVASGVGKLTMRPALGHEVKLTGITYETKYATGQPNGPPNTLSIYDTKVQNQILTARYRYSRPDDKLFDFDGNVYSTSTLTEQVKTGGTNSAIIGPARQPAQLPGRHHRLRRQQHLARRHPGLNNTVTYGADLLPRQGRASSIRPAPATCSRPMACAPSRATSCNGEPTFDLDRDHHGAALRQLQARRRRLPDRGRSGVAQGHRRRHAGARLHRLRHLCGGLSGAGRHRDADLRPASAGRPDAVRLHSQSAA